MSIIIRGIDMPKRKNDVLLVKIFPNGGINWWNALGVGEVARTQTGRAEQLPPHGRLIDADAALDIMRDRMCGTGYQSYAMEVLAYEYLTPTLIEAEGGNEENDKP